MSVVEHDLDRVIANGLNRDDGDIFLACDNLLLAGRMALNLGAWGNYASITGKWTAPSTTFGASGVGMYVSGE